MNMEQETILLLQQYNIDINANAINYVQPYHTHAF